MYIYFVFHRLLRSSATAEGKRASSPFWGDIYIYIHIYIYTQSNAYIYIWGERHGYIYIHNMWLSLNMWNSTYVDGAW